MTGIMEALGGVSLYFITGIVAAYIADCVDDGDCGDVTRIIRVVGWPTYAVLLPVLAFEWVARKVREVRR